MARRRKQDDPETLRKKLVALLIDFEEELKSDELRNKVLALVPANSVMRDLGISLIPKECASSAMERILSYFQKYLRVVINGEELMVVAGISEWARRVRQLRKEFGWSIVSGVTAKEMAEEEEFSLPGIDAARMKVDEYILMEEGQDRDAAFRWNTANSIRRNKDTNVHEKLVEYLRANLGKRVSGEELRYVAGDQSDWARRVRELRTEQGWQIVTKTTGMPDLPVGVYVLASDRQAPEHDRVIKDSIRREVLRRDGYRCQQCKWHPEIWNPSDPRHLEAHHIQQHVDRGENTVENLITLCNVCHDEEHAKAKR